MTRSELVKRLSRRYPDLAEIDIYQSIILIHDAIFQALRLRKRVEIRDFGVFELSHRRPRVARNPKTGQTFQVADKYVPHFRPGKRLRERIEASGQRGTKLLVETKGPRRS